MYRAGTGSGPGRYRIYYCTLDMNRLIGTEAAAGSAAGCWCGRPRVRPVRGAPSFRAHQTFWAGGAEYAAGSGRGAAGPSFRPSSGPALRRHTD